MTTKIHIVLSSPEHKAQVRYFISTSMIRGPSFRHSTYTFSNKFISKVRWPILIEFHVKHHQVKGNTALG